MFPVLSPAISRASASTSRSMTTTLRIVAPKARPGGEPRMYSHGTGMWLSAPWRNRSNLPYRRWTSAPIYSRCFSHHFRALQIFKCIANQWNHHSGINTSPKHHHRSFLAKNQVLKQFCALSVSACIGIAGTIPWVCSSKSS